MSNPNALKEPLLDLKGADILIREAMLQNRPRISYFLDSYYEADLDKLEKACDLLKMAIAARRLDLNEHC